MLGDQKSKNSNSKSPPHHENTMKPKMDYLTANTISSAQSHRRVRSTNKDLASALAEKQSKPRASISPGDSEAK